MDLLELARRRKSVRPFSREPIQLTDVLYAIEVSLEAPSGANCQPWEFLLVEDTELKSRIRDGCERAERRFHGRVRGNLAEWLSEGGIDWRKPFLEDAPYLVVVFARKGEPYSIQSTWLTCGMALTSTLLPSDRSEVSARDTWCPDPPPPP